MVYYIENQGLNNPNQHGFRSGYSCLSQLLQHHDRISKFLEEGSCVDVIYLDFAKAFDKLDFLLTILNYKKLASLEKSSSGVGTTHLLLLVLRHFVHRLCMKG